MSATATRRRFLASGVGLAATAVLPAVALGAGHRSVTGLGRAGLAKPSPDQVPALRALGRHFLRLPGSLPFAELPVGTDTMPQVEHIVYLMLENHSYDNLLGMLRGPFGRPRGDGFRIAFDGFPANSNPQPDGTPLRAYHMPTTCQPQPSQNWHSSHIQYANGTNQGFVISPSGPGAMGYWTRQDMPVLYDLATNFPIGDRYFCSVLGQTDPNRRYAIAATSSGMVDDIPDPAQLTTLGAIPANGTIFSRLSDANISWLEYSAAGTGVLTATESLYPVLDIGFEAQHLKTIDAFFADCAAGTLPSFSFLDAAGDEQEHPPADVVVGDAFLRTIVEAIGASPKWRQTVLIVNYDEHGGYYDHVPPPPALAPDDVAPVLEQGDVPFDGFKRYGFRVPCIIISAYAKRNHVSHVLYDHASPLALIERKWNLPAMTYRDANANDMTDSLDLRAMKLRRPTFPELPPLAQSAESPATLACETTGPGQIPPTDTPPPLPRHRRRR